MLFAGRSSLGLVHTYPDSGRGTNVMPRPSVLDLFPSLCPGQGYSSGFGGEGCLGKGQDWVWEDWSVCDHNAKGLYIDSTRRGHVSSRKWRNFINRLAPLKPAQKEQGASSGLQ